MSHSSGESTGPLTEGQSGMVLLICLIFMTALTLLGLAASADAILQKQLSVNLQETERTRQSAMATLALAENRLLELDSPALQSCPDECDGLQIHDPGELPPYPEFKDYYWWLDHGQTTGSKQQNGRQKSSFDSGSVEHPLWIIERAHVQPASENPAGESQIWYRILARASSRTGASVSVIESLVVRSWPGSNGAQKRDKTGSKACGDAWHAMKCGRVTWRELL